MTNKFGGPDHFRGKAALPHLRRLVTSVLHRAATQQPTDVCDVHKDGSSSASKCNTTTLDLRNDLLSMSKETPFDSVSVAAFSKGCVVLNQLVTEIFLLSELPQEEREDCLNFLNKVSTN